MDDRQHAVQPARAKARRVPADGIIGRLTYTPARGDGSIGQIRRNRAKDETPRFKQVTPFTQWCAPTRTPTSQPSDMRPSQVLRSQNYWLLEHLPEASIGDEGIESLLLEEVAASQAKGQPAPGETAPLFSVGEVTDLRESESAKGHPVLAVASGVSGNVLRLISLAPEEWVWTEADIRVRVHAANSKLEGEWYQEGAPISLVKFAVDSRKYDPIRWLLVSNGAATTVYEPELRTIPMPTARTSTRVPGRPVGHQIFGGPLFTIPCERTGGSLHSDVCFTRHLQDDIPQLAIIDQAGYWSLWDITGRRNARPKNLTPVLKMCGNTVTGSIPKLPSNSMAEPQSHKLLWLSLGQKTSEPSRRSASRTRSPSEHSRMSVEPEPQPPRRILLLCSPKALHLFDLAAQKSHSVSHLVLQKDTHRILGVSPSRLDPAQAFILTSTNLLWVAAKEGKKNTLTLNILVSCPHQKDVNDPTLRLDVSPGAYINGLMACFVCVRSAKDTEMTVLWFINPEPGTTPVRYHRDLISLERPSNFAGLSILPAGRRMGDEPTSAAGRAMRNAQLRFFQLLTLGQDLDVHSALCAWSDEAGVSVPPPDTREALGEGGNRRLRLLQSLTDAFAVPDEFDERAVFGKRGVDGLALEGLNGGIQLRVDFGLAAQRVISGAPADGGEDGEASQADGVDFGFIAEAVERKKADDYMPRHSLLDLAASQRTGGDLLQLAREWDAQQEALHRRAGDWFFVPEARRPLIAFGPDDLVERLRDLFVEPQPSKNPPYQKREEALQTMAAEMFLSNTGVSAVPQSWTTTPESQLASSLPFPSSPSLMSSQPSLPSSHKSKAKGKAKAEPEQGDAVALRLRKYAALDASPTVHGEPVLALSRWNLGADPDDISWKPGQDLDAEDAINRRRRKVEARRRKAERLSQRVFGAGEDSVLLADLSSQSLGVTQPLPTILSTGAGSQSQRQSQTHGQSQQPALPWDFSSQQQPVDRFASPRVFPGSPRVVRPGSPLRKEYRRDSGAVRGGGVFSSQLARPEQQGGASQGMSQGTPSQPKSQVLPGLFGARPSFSPFKRSPVKRGKRKSEVRLSGFR